jgi:hypothetical protein
MILTSNIGGQRHSKPGVNISSSGTIWNFGGHDVVRIVLLNSWFIDGKAVIHGLPFSRVNG